MTRRLPILALLLGIAGMLPFIGCGLLAVGRNPDAGAAALAAYGATILAFLGGVHWGFALPDPSRRGERARLLLGVLPSLTGWVALLLGVAFQVEVALGVLLAGFLGTTIVEARATRLGLVPAGYMALRWGLSAVVVVVLAVTILLRLVGAHITI